MNTEPESVLTFWLADAAATPAAHDARQPFWYQPDAETDASITRQFAPAVEAAAGGALAHWEESARSCLALVILLDQFPRNLFRGRPGAFHADALALATSERGIERGYLDGFSPCEQGFLLMPFQHTEDLAAQRRGVGHFERLHEAAAPAWRDAAQRMLDYARLHLEIVERFGRFPHRNAILGREPSAEERAYLESGGESFGQKA